MTKQMIGIQQVTLGIAGGIKNPDTRAEEEGETIAYRRVESEWEKCGAEVTTLRKQE